MPAGHTLGQLFAPEPMQWGLRGDPYLWREIKRRRGRRRLPVRLDQVEELLQASICDVLGTDWRTFTSSEHVYDADLAHGGMSSGHVSVSAWTDRPIPLLLARAAALHDYSWISPAARDGW